MHQIRDDDLLMKRILNFYAQNCSKVEIIKENEALFQFFPILPFCNFKSENPKDKFLRNVNRTNAKTK